MTKFFLQLIDRCILCTRFQVYQFKSKNALLCILDIDLFPGNSMIESTQRLLRNFLCNKQIKYKLSNFIKFILVFSGRRFFVWRWQCWTLRQFLSCWNKLFKDSFSASRWTIAVDRLIVVHLTYHLCAELLC